MIAATREMGSSLNTTIYDSNLSHETLRGSLENSNSPSH